MDRNVDVPEQSRLGDQIGARLGQQKAAIDTCGGWTIIFGLPISSLLRCVNVAPKPAFSHP
ncbi:MAG TPA: hypothetical protein PLO16_02965 [Acidocella sp.]|nr:hypothetical protein [Acidocella sp.]